MAETVIVFNPHAGNTSGTLARVKAQAQANFGECETFVSESIDQLQQNLVKFLDSGTRRILGVGGDGTNNVLLNLLMPLADQYDITYGNIPTGSGRDFARTIGTPLELEDAIHWLSQREAKPIDVGQIHYAEGSKYFLNTCSIGVSYEVNTNVNNAGAYRPWTYLVATLKAAFQFNPLTVSIHINGSEVYRGQIFLAVFGNGTTFGSGMKIAPHAKLDDNLLEVVIVEFTEPIPPFGALASVYTGSHLDRSKVHYYQAQAIEVHVLDGQIGCETDGEIEKTTGNVKVEVTPGKLKLLY